MTILPLLFAGILLLLKKAAFLGKFAMFITGLLGFGNLLSLGQFSGINNYHQHHHQPHRPFGFGGNHHGTFGDSLSGGYYKTAPNKQIAYHEFATTESDPAYADQFYNYERKILQNKSDKTIEKGTKLTSTERSARAASYRNFVWQSS